MLRLKYRYLALRESRVAGPALRLLEKTFSEFSNDGCASMAAALAYYAVFALPGLLVLIIAIAGLAVDAATIQGTIEGQMRTMIGARGGEQIRTMIEHTAISGSGPVGLLIGFFTIAFGATGIVVQLQSALNAAWEVQPDPAQGGLKNFIFKRVLSFGMILAIAFLLLVSLVLSAIVGAAGNRLGAMLPGAVSEPMLVFLNLILSLIVITMLFAAMFKFLPDALIAWRDVWVGALVTALLFTAGKAAMGLYLGEKDVGSAYGAAGSLALVLLWIYYSCMILLFGAEFTQSWATRSGAEIRPSPGAVRIVKTSEKAYA